jgi:nitroreductase/Pyruvate/2-oxoacid:ferredoxin oxidoreductase delta subunit
MRRPIDTEIDPELCTGCGECVRVCPSEAIAMVDGKAVVTGEFSIGCGHCAAICPTDAIEVGFEDGTALELVTVQETGDFVAPGEFDASALVRLMRSRRSCRNYAERPVPREVLEDLVKIGTTAPSGTNCQLWTFTLLPDRQAVLTAALAVRQFFERLNRKAANPFWRLLARLFAKDALGRYHRDYSETVERGLRQWEEEGCDRLFHGAPAAILVGSAPGASCPAEDALLASQNILLAAHAMGLGTCLVGFVVEAMKNDPSIKRALGIPPSERIYAVIALGYPDEPYVRPTGRRRVEPRYHSAGSRPLSS